MNALSKSFNHGGHDKDKSTEINRVKQYLFKNTATAAMVADKLNIRIPNVCRHKRELEKQGALKVLKKGICKLTNYKAFYLTTNLKGGADV